MPYVCPIYRNVGGHTYGTTYCGPIGAVITPHLRGLQEWKHLSYCSSLCGACTEACPVKIDLHHHLLQNRRNAVGRRLDPWPQRVAFRVWRWLMQGGRRFALAGKLGRLALRFGVARPFVGAWTRTRELPPPPAQSFRAWWAASQSSAPPNGPRSPEEPTP